ncbi:ABC transporter permease [Nonomuraea sp. NPDC050790]|uniref:ABC transporter permease n=1 Tax=Nonomuraea sp. NPDC050790 TaxID=3364371 RepID=UPI003789EB84
MSTAETETGTRRMPGLVPVSETRRSAERAVADAPGEPVPAEAEAPGGAVAFWRLLRSELGLTFRRPRNLVMLGVLALVPVIIGVVLKSIGTEEADGGMGALLAATAGNSLMLTFVALSALVPLLMPIAVAVVAGDSIAGEAGGGTLRYLLAAPAGRGRLLAVKYLNAVAFAAAVTAAVAASALVVGMVLFPVGPVTLLSGTTVSFAEGLLRILITVGYVTAGMAALAAVAMALSTLTEVPIGSIATTLVLIIVTQVLRAFPQLDAVAPYLLPTHWSGFDGALRDPIGDMSPGLLAFAAYVFLFLSLSWARFSGKDISS